ncbi:hypothetical protein [Microbispora bryophytorum]|uniref:hypothetical protein n=1 Tax=Microbispora bryophytorum TaxID=1460882 RepID=UPI0033CC7169
MVVEAVTSEVGEQAGKLIGAAGMSTDQAVDAMVAATALAQEGPVVIVTSDVPHLTALTAGHERIQVVHVDKITPIAPSRRGRLREPAYLIRSHPR